MTWKNCIFNLICFVFEELYGKLQTLKSKRPSLKLILRITDDNGRTYSQLAKKAQSRASFIKNTVE